MAARMKSTFRADVIKMCNPLNWQKEAEMGSRLMALKKKKKKVPTHLIKVSDSGWCAFINLVCSPHGHCLLWRRANPAEGGML